MASTPTPGTVLLVDVDGLFNDNHAPKSRDIVLVPQPTDDPDDPLRWTTSRKTRNMLCALAWCFFDAAIISGLSPAYILIEQDTGISIADLSTGNGILFLFLGWGTLVTQCLALNYGRRPTLVISMLLSIAVTVWTAYVKTRGEFFINRILLGILCSPQETLIEVVIGDIYFAHDRGFYMGAYSWTLWCGAFLAPVASGYVAENLGWRWIQYILALISAAVTVVTFFFFEETMFYRDLRPETTTLNPNQAVAAVQNGPMVSDTEKKQDILEQETIPSTLITTANVSNIPPSTKTYLQKLKIWGFRHPKQPNTFKLFFLPLQLLFMLPGMVFGGFLVGGILAWYNVVGGSLALILGNAPYNFSANNIGLTYLACVVGVSIGCFLSGWMSDALALRLARRNGGVMEPEQRLWTCVIALVMHPAGCLLYGVGASYHIHWVAVVFGLGLISITLPMGANLAFTYILDSYREVAGEGLVSAILIRNLMGFAFGYAVVPMIDNLGLRYAFVLIAVLGLALWCSAIVMIYAGKPLRRVTAKSYWNLVERYGATAH
ncbi:major facilitator superfamily protein [Pochonia chlamydosporia 170]|uniref:Major facilitator superfamily protein n=1 Tax=Pochonia chlamydosporia 170 TaxID=1380566 RepID=A0A179FEU7_METCM|nr:major facilitator superfamily protein [Pochonia chlamydosporia 170]OAQ64036.1 major facilitator superfamily protein [Pochonia chlamydosporia 170]